MDNETVTTVNRETRRANERKRKKQHEKRALCMFNRNRINQRKAERERERREEIRRKNARARELIRERTGR